MQVSSYALVLHGACPSHNPHKGPSILYIVPYHRGILCHADPVMYIAHSLQRKSASYWSYYVHSRLTTEEVCTILVLLCTQPPNYKGSLHHTGPTMYIASSLQRKSAPYLSCYVHSPLTTEEVCTILVLLCTQPPHYRGSPHNTGPTIYIDPSLQRTSTPYWSYYVHSLLTTEEVCTILVLLCAQSPHYRGSLHHTGPTMYIAHELQRKSAPYWSYYVHSPLTTEEVYTILVLLYTQPPHYRGSLHHAGPIMCIAPLPQMNPTPCQPCYSMQKALTTEATFTILALLCR